ncbi:hypothetical protein D3P07_21575 [Paenibacillus sp. 1011MAR3C5]|uniref:hypothetical protein n=1 Tax=Paenibacillus sp. 1011MAR3C5 TaxID=1675787 RepID=UPI000E6C3C82|nr:hypothetical protein [Paenibacillus sp. 1011MAR3C5]RJE85161.1 hypothetical protein D3P07_21575 [Paenibacillus sp. 1011MAR3C5]
MKIRQVLSILLAIVFVIVIADRLTFTSFQKQVLDQLGDNEPIKIHVHRFSDGGKLTIKDKEIMQNILEDLANTKLWKVDRTP